MVSADSDFARESRRSREWPRMDRWEKSVEFLIKIRQLGTEQAAKRDSTATRFKEETFIDRLLLIRVHSRHSRAKFSHFLLTLFKS